MPGNGRSDHHHIRYVPPTRSWTVSRLCGFGFSKEPDNEVWSAVEAFSSCKPDSWSKGCEFESRQERRENFFSRVKFVCWLLFGVRITPVLPQWHVKDPSHSAKSADGRLHIKTHTPLTQGSRSGLTICRCPGIVWEPIGKRSSSHATCQGTLGHNRLSLLLA